MGNGSGWDFNRRHPAHEGKSGAGRGVGHGGQDSEGPVFQGGGSQQGRRVRKRVRSPRAGPGQPPRLQRFPEGRGQGATRFRPGKRGCVQEGASEGGRLRGEGEGRLPHRGAGPAGSRMGCRRETLPGQDQHYSDARRRCRRGAMSKLVSFAGIFVLMGVAWLLSADRRVVNWRVVLWGTGLQILLALFIFVVPAGSKVFVFVNDAVVKVLDSASAGTRFLFGRLALPPGAVGEGGEESLGFILAFQALPTIVFFSSLMAALYFLGVMPRLVRFFAGIFTRFLRLSGAESLSVSSNIFVGVEANMTVLPHLGRMTRSELCTILSAGVATTASNGLAPYVFPPQKQVPAT